MDTEALISHSRSRFDHESRKRVLREKYKAKMLFAHGGGLWEAGPPLLNLLSCCKNDTAVILDLYDNPVEVQVSTLMDMAHERWQEQMNAWLNEANSTSK